MSKKETAKSEDGPGSAKQLITEAPSSKPPLVFISHDGRDADLAEEFDNLLRDASGGMLKSFRSSDKKGTAGMEYGEEWYNAIMSKLGDATDVVALLTPHSIDRPWILYEAGVAKGKIGGKVLGLVIGVPFEKASIGPFYQFQNCPHEEEAIVGLVMQLIKRNPSAEPRTEAVRLQVRAFLERVTILQKKRGAQAATSASGRVDESSVAKLFEEVKVTLRDLPDKVEEKMQETLGRQRPTRRKMFHPMMLEQLMFEGFESPDGETATWLLLGALTAEDIPWLHELAMEMYRVTCSRNPELIAAARDAARRTLRALSESHAFHRLMRDDDPEARSLARHLPEMLDHLLERSEAAMQTPTRAVKGERRTRRVEKG